MHTLRRIVGALELLNVWTMKVFSWLVIATMFLITYEVVARYVFNSPTAWSYDISYMVGGTFMMIGVGYVLTVGRHVRVDILWVHFSNRVKAGIDAVLTLLLFFPLTYVMLQFSVEKAIHGWQIGEKGGVGYWMPPLSPFRTALCIAIALLMLAGVAWFIRSAYTLVKGESL
jgi:TRAP-type mannitol/chloroaromatic compound transport system permease small subunit